MGAEFQTAYLKSEGRVGAEKEFRELQEKCRYDHGHAGYTGSFAEANGIEFKPNTFESEEEAYSWLSKNTEKWEAAIAVKIKGKGGWYIGACCSS